jgi:hypothetical protein
MKMPRGHHKGEDIDDIPTDYLKWVSTWRGCDDVVREAERILKIRKREGTAVKSLPLACMDKKVGGDSC